MEELLPLGSMYLQDSLESACSQPAETAAIYFNQLECFARNIDKASVGHLAALLATNVQKGHTLFVAGNGGSASTASHFVCDIICTSSQVGLRTARVIGLADNSSLLSALANDFGYDSVFSRQLELQAHRGDLLLLLSVSGRSQNLVRAAKTARTLGVRVCAVLGLPNAELEQHLDHVVLINCADYGLVEDIALSLNHLVARMLNGHAPRLCATLENLGRVGS